MQLHGNSLKIIKNYMTVLLKNNEIQINLFYNTSYKESLRINYMMVKIYISKVGIRLSLLKKLI